MCYGGRAGVQLKVKLKTFFIRNNLLQTPSYPKIVKTADKTWILGRTL